MSRATNGKPALLEQARSRECLYCTCDLICTLGLNNAMGRDGLLFNVKVGTLPSSVCVLVGKEKAVSQRGEGQRIALQT